MTYFKRLIELPKKHSFFLFGPRQVGKTTLLNHSFSSTEIKVYNLLDFNLIKNLEKDPSIFFQEISSRDKSKIKYILLDEIQKLPWILDEVHRVIENSTSPPIFILTGSSARKLRRSNANMLGGRALSKTLFPLIYDEIKNHREFSINEVLSYGTLPPVYLAHSPEDKIEILRSYTSIYIKEEIKEEALVRRLGEFSQFLLLASIENGNIINYSNISQDIGISLNTVKEYYSILIDTLMGFVLFPMLGSIRKKISKSPKFYFFDTGVQRALAERLRSPLIKGTEEFGKAFEHWLIKEIIHKTEYMKREYRFSFYRVNDNVEVDLVIQTPLDQIIAIEIKGTDNPKEQKLKGLKSFAKVFPEAKLICASLVENRRNLDSGIVIMPWQEVLEMV